MSLMTCSFINFLRLTEISILITVREIEKSNIMMKLETYINLLYYCDIFELVLYYLFLSIFLENLQRCDTFMIIARQMKLLRL